MSYIDIWLHVVFATKNRAPIIHPFNKEQLYEQIKSSCIKHNIYLDSIGGHTDHVHLLISIGKTQSIADLVRLIKGSSSFAYNKEATGRQIHWQDDYFAVSVSKSQLDNVRRYINCQEEHHRKKSFTEEVQEFFRKYGWKE